MIKSKFNELIYGLISSIITILLNLLFDVENKWLSELITISIFFIFYSLIKQVKNFFSPFSLKIDVKNKHNTQKPNETDIIIKNNLNYHTTESMRTITVKVNFSFKNTLSKKIINSVVKKNTIFICMRIDSEELKFSTKKVSMRSDLLDRRNYYYDLTNEFKILSKSEHSNLNIVEDIDLIIEYIGTELPNSTTRNIHFSLESSQNNKWINFILWIFKSIEIENFHKIYISRLEE